MVYKSKFLRYLLTVFYFPSYLLGRFEQKQTLNLILKDNFVDNPVIVFYYSFLLNKHATFYLLFFQYLPANKFVITIHEKIQFYSVKFVVEANFTGLK